MKHQHQQRFLHEGLNNKKKWSQMSKTKNYLSSRQCTISQVIENNAQSALVRLQSALWPTVLSRSSLAATETYFEIKGNRQMTLSRIKVILLMIRIDFCKTNVDSLFNPPLVICFDTEFGAANSVNWKPKIFPWIIKKKLTKRKTRQKNNMLL